MESQTNNLKQKLKEEEESIKKIITTKGKI